MDALLQQAAFWRGQGNAAQSEHVLRRALTVEPRNAAALAALVQLQADGGGNLEAARTSLAQPAAAAPDDRRAEALGALARAGPADPQAVAETHGLLRSGRATEAVASYRRSFTGDTPPASLATEYDQALAATDAGWQLARDRLAQQAGSNPEDLRGQFAYAQVLTLREATRLDGIARFERLMQKPGIAAEAKAAYRQALLWLPEAPGAARGLVRPGQRDRPAQPAEPVDAVSGPAVNSGKILIARMHSGEVPLPAAPAQQPAPVAVPPRHRPQRYAQYVPADTTTDAPPEVPPAFQPFVCAGGTQPMPRAIDPTPVHARPLMMPAILDLPLPSKLVGNPVFADEPLPPLSSVNPFRGAPSAEPQTVTPDLLDAPPRMADRTMQDIDHGIAQLSKAMAPQVYGVTIVRERSGSDGASRLTDLEAPMEATYSPNGYGKLKVSVTPVALWANQVAAGGFDQWHLGTNALAAVGARSKNQHVAGSAPDLSYASGSVTADIGATPLGFLQQSVIGGVEYAPSLSQNLRLHAVVERRAVTDSLLSYAGAKDPATGTQFGGVTLRQDHYYLIVIV